MFTKGNKTFADAWYYLKSKVGNSIGFTINGDPDDYDEISIGDDLDVQVDSKRVFLCGRKFMFLPQAITYAEIKKKITKSRYTYDDQMAILLNKDKSEEDMMLFNKMQEWREFASEVARLATQNS